MRRTLLPGFIDAHAHVPSENGLRNGLRFGVTTLLDMFTRVEVMQAHRAQRDLLVQTDLSDLPPADFRPPERGPRARQG
jgi:predicted amidohydrolase YtcJ